MPPLFTLKIQTHNAECTESFFRDQILTELKLNHAESNASLQLRCGSDLPASDLNPMSSVTEQTLDLLEDLSLKSDLDIHDLPPMLREKFFQDVSCA
jgi:hypothetical protein